MQIFQFVMALMITGSFLGCVAFYKKNPKLSGMLGVAVIVLGGASFAIEVIAFGLTKEGAERLVLISTAVVGTPAVAYYWFRVWQRKRPDAVSR